MGSLAGFPRRDVRATPAVLTDPSAFIGEQRAIGQFGQRVAGVGAAELEKRNIELARADFTAMKAATATSRNEFLRTLRTTDDDYNEINKKWGTFKKKTFKNIGNTTKQRRAQQAYGSWVKGVIPLWDQDVDNIAWGISAQRAKVKVFNSAVEMLRTGPDFNVALLEAGMAIDESNLLTSEQKDLALANAVIETNPQWYLENVDSEKTKMLFELLTTNQKRSLETKARESINRIRTDQQRAQQVLNDETRKTAAELWRKNELSSNWLEANRPNMSGPDYERYNNHLISKAKSEKKFQNNLRKIEDPFNREIFGKLDAANTIGELGALQDTVNDYASAEQKKLSVAEAKKWSADIDKKRDELIVTKAESYPEWSRLSDRITEVQANTAEIEVVRREIDRAVIPPEGQEAKITPELAMSLRARLEGIEKNPAVKKRPSLTRAHSLLGRLREQQIDVEVGAVLDKEDFAKIIVIENLYTRKATELDEYADTVAGDKDFDAKIEEKLRTLIEPEQEKIVKNTFGNFLKGLFGLTQTEEEARRLFGFEPKGEFGRRADGTEKGLGFFGVLQRPDGRVSTEISVGVEFDGKETEIPTLIPTLTSEEIKFLLDGGEPTKKIIDKAVAHAKKRIKQGKSPFAEKGEQGVTATNPKTGKKVISFDGGKTWQSL